MERTERKEKDENDKSVLPLTILYSTFFRPFQKPHQFTLPINSYPRVETFSKSFLRKEERETRMKKQKKKKKKRSQKSKRLRIRLFANDRYTIHVCTYIHSNKRMRSIERNPCDRIPFADTGLRFFQSGTRGRFLDK